MMWIVKCLAIVVVSLHCAKCDVVDADVIDAVPADVNTESAVVFDIDRTGTKAVKYDGAQLWRISYRTQETKNAVAELQKQFQVSMWNLQMNNLTEPYVDMFVKSAMVNDAKEFLLKALVPFTVVISDVQNAINTENPSMDEVELWQNRNGELNEPTALKHINKTLKHPRKKVSLNRRNFHKKK